MYYVMVLVSFMLQSVQVKKRFPANHNNNHLIPSIFSAFNHGGIVLVGMKNKAILSFFTPNIFLSIR